MVWGGALAACVRGVTVTYRMPGGARGASPEVFLMRACERVVGGRVAYCRVTVVCKFLRARFRAQFFLPIREMIR